MNLTIAYVTNRREPHLEWFFNSLKLQLQTDDNIQFIYVSHHPPQYLHTHLPFIEQITHSLSRSPKPNVWSGEHRLTKEDYFSAANTRNTAVCYCDNEWIVFIDDLSVLEPHWLMSVRYAMEAKYAVFGAYQKVSELIVKDGKAVHFKQAGRDNRLDLVTADVTPCNGQWCYGCSMALPLEWILQVNGFPENLCDGMGFEDVLFGFGLQNKGFPMRYDRRMMTIESEEDHHKEPAMKRSDFGTSPNDKSHRALEIAMTTSRFENDFNLRELRQKTLAGEPFPIRLNPQHEWFTGTPLADL